MRALGRLLRRVVLLAVGVGAAVGLGAWKFSELFKDDALIPPGPTEPQYDDAEVVAVTDGHITLSPLDGGRPDVVLPGRYGARWPGGHGRIGDIVEVTEFGITREFTSVVGTPRVGDRVTADGTYFYRDPLLDHGIAYETVQIPSSVGDLDAWHVDGDSDTWVIVAHGKGVDAREALRMLPAFVDVGLPSVTISYRNDIGAPADPSGRYQFGLTEWEDLEAAVDWAVERGARRVALVGFSMGGAITMEFMHRSTRSELVAGLILDSPLLDLSRTVDTGSAQMGVPPLMNALAKSIVSSRFDLEWDEMNYLAKASSVDVPILLFHGTADRRVPIELSEDLAERLSDQVEFVKVEGAGHVESWNVATDAYMDSVARFLTDLR